MDYKPPWQLGFVASMDSFDFVWFFFCVFFFFFLVRIWIYVRIYVQFVGPISIARRKCSEDSDRSYEGTTRHFSHSVGGFRSKTQGLSFFFFFFFFLFVKWIIEVLVRPWVCCSRFGVRMRFWIRVWRCIDVILRSVISGKWLNFGDWSLMMIWCDVLCVVICARW